MVVNVIIKNHWLMVIVCIYRLHKSGLVVLWLVNKAEETRTLRLA